MNKDLMLKKLSRSTTGLREQVDGIRQAWARVRARRTSIPEVREAWPGRCGVFRLRSVVLRVLAVVFRVL